MSNIPALEARYTANIIQFDRELKRMQSLNAKAANRILKDHEASARKVNQTWGNANLGQAIRRSVGGGLNGLKGDLASLSGMLAGAMSVQAAVGLADTYTRFANSLRVAGVQGAAFAQVQDHLFASASRNGVAIESLGQLYGRVSSAAAELGVSQGQILRVTDAVSAAIRVSGGDASSASGAMLQMAQALGSGTVRAEEFNSMVEGMLPLVQAAAGASATYGGSVARMRADVLAGKLSSKEFFDLILAGSAALEAKAARAPLTVGQSFENLKTKLIEAMGAADATWGITDRLAEALKWLSENLDTVAESLGVVALVISATMAPAIGKAVVGMAALTATSVGAGVRMAAQIPAMLAFSASLQGISVGAAAARTGLSLLMSATGVGLAVVALTAAIGFFAARSYKAAEATRQLRERLDEKTRSLNEAREAANTARQQTGDLTSAELQAATAAAALTGEQDKLKDAYYRVAAAAKAAELAQLRANLTQSESDLRQAGQDYRREYDGRVRQSFSGGGSPFSPNGSSTAIANAGDTTRRAREATDSSEAGTALTNASRGLAADRQALRDAEQRKLDEFAPTRTTGGGGGGSRSGGGSSGSSAEDRRRNAEDAVAQANRDLADATRALAISVDDRHAAALAALDDDRTQASREIARRVVDKEIDAATAAELNSIEDKVTAAKKAAEDQRHREELEARSRYLASLENDAAQERINLEADAADYLARTSVTLQERQVHERSALAARQRADDQAFEAAQESLRLELVKQNVTQAEIDTILARQRANHEAAKGQATGQLQNDQRQDRPETLAEWIAQMGRAEAGAESFGQKLMGVASEGLNAISDGITDAIMGAKNFAEAMQEMAKSVIASLIKMAVQFVIFETIGRAFGIQGLGKAAIGLPSGSAPPVGHNAAGTNNWRGGLTSINEAGPEILNLPSGTQIIPHRLAKQMARPSASAPANQHFNITTVVNADNAVLRSDIDRMVAQSHVMAVREAKAQTINSIRSGQKNRLR